MLCLLSEVGIRHLPDTGGPSVTANPVTSPDPTGVDGREDEDDGDWLSERFDEHRTAPARGGVPDARLDQRS